MKSVISIAAAVANVLFMAALVINPLTSHSSTKGGGDGKAIPDKIMRIADKSCVRCHTEPGDFMALSHLNLSNWTKYSPEKQAAKAKAMCNMVTKDKMPPKGFREKHAEDVPTLEQTNTICNWAQSIKVSKK